MKRAGRWLLGIAGAIAALVIVFVVVGVFIGPHLPPADPSRVPAPAIDTAPAGGKPTLILLHGAGLNAHMWDAAMKHIDPRWRVIAIDLPGHGARSNEAFTLEAGKHAVADAAKRAASEPVVLVGDSLGGYTAIASASVVPPSQLRGLFVAGAAGDLPGHFTAKDWALRIFFRWMIALGDEQALAAKALAKYEVPPVYAQSMLASGVHLGAVESSVDALAGVRFEPMLEGITQPVLFVNGADDPEHTTGEISYLRAARNSMSLKYPGVGHGISMRRAERFAADLNAFAARAFGVAQ